MNTSTSASELVTDQVSTFYVDGAWYGIDVESVLEVGRLSDLTAVPLAPPEVMGLMNLRGRIVTAIDLKKRLGITSHHDQESRMNVIVTANGNVVSLVVDKIGDVLDLDQTLYEETPDSVEPQAKEIIKGVFKMEGCFLHILDVQKTLNTSEGIAKSDEHDQEEEEES